MNHVPIISNFINFMNADHVPDRYEIWAGETLDELREIYKDCNPAELRCKKIAKRGIEHIHSTNNLGGKSRHKEALALWQRLHATYPDLVTTDDRPTNVVSQVWKKV